MSDRNASPHNTDDLISPTTSNGFDSANTLRDSAASNERKRKAATSSRGVANLSAEQLAKKRANDREAQRAIRERTKTQIESLERRIKELTSQQPYQELQNILRQKELVELENAEIKRRLSAVLDLIRPILTSNVIADVQRSSVEAILNHPQSHTHGSQIGGAHTQITIPSFGAIGTPLPKLSPPLWQVSTTHTSSTVDSLIRRTSTTVSSRGSYNASTPNSIRNGSEERRDLSLHQPGRPETHTQPHHMDDGRVLINNKHILADHHNILNSPTRMLYHQPNHSRNEGNSRQLWESVPPWTGAASVFDGLLLKFTLDARSRRAQGISEYEIVGPMYPNFEAITYPNHIISCHPMSCFLRDILGPFPDVSIIANKAGIAYIMFIILRWLISPTRENFERLPLWCRPVPCQLTISHAIWIDLIPWPDMRAEMVRNPDLYPFDQFFVPHSKTESLNWDHSDEAMYVEGSNADGEYVLSQMYETHIRDLNNWTLGPAFAREFPVLASTCRITTRGEDERRKQAEAMKSSSR